MNGIVKLGLAAILWVTPAPQQSTQDYLRGLVGQRLILRHYAGSASIRTKEKDLGRRHGGCDEAVEVETISFDGGSLAIRLRNIGTLVVQGKPVSCTVGLPEEYLLKITDFGFDQPSDQAEKSIENVLQTPEECLAAYGVAFNPTPASGNESPIDFPQTGLTAPKPLLLVNPFYSETNRKARIQGRVTVRCVIGTDGLARDPVIASGLTRDLDKLAVDALTFYRLEPAHNGAGPVAVRMPVEFAFRLL